MNYQKKVIDKYAVGQYCEIEYCTKYGWTGKREGWLVPNDWRMFKTIKMYKYALLGPNNTFFAFNVNDFTKITIVSNHHTLPKTISKIEKAEKARKRVDEYVDEYVEKTSEGKEK